MDDSFDTPEFRAHEEAFHRQRTLLDTATIARTQHLDWSFDSLDESINPQLYWSPIQTGGQIDDHIQITREFDQRVAMLNTVGTAFRVCPSWLLPLHLQVRYHNLENVNDLMGLIHKSLDRLIRMIDNPQPQDRVGMQIVHPDLDVSIAYS